MLFQKRHKKSCHSADQDIKHGGKGYRRDRTENHSCEDKQNDRPVKKRFLQAPQHLESGRKDQIDDTDLNPAKSQRDDPKTQKTVEEQGDRINDDKGWEADCKGRYGRTRNADDPVTDKGCAVDGHGPRSGFCNCSHVQKFILGQPVFPVNKFPVQEGEHGISAAEGEGSDFQKGKK